VALKLFTKSSLSAPFSTNAKGRVVNLYADRANTANAAANSTRLGGKTLSQVIASAQPVVSCAKGGACAVGNAGPGNGTVFYDAGSMQAWGRYLEVAPTSWNGQSLNPDTGTADPKLAWCVGGANPSSRVPGGALGLGLGAGWANTERTARYCDSGAAVSARGYHGGGKADWYLPSRDEINQLCRWALGQDSSSTAACDQPQREGPFAGNLAGAVYWSSSESADTAGYAWFIQFALALQEPFTKTNIYYVRPIRAF
jgi:hypothetical protein